MYCSEEGAACGSQSTGNSSDAKGSITINPFTPDDPLAFERVEVEASGRIRLHLQIPGQRTCEIQVSDDLVNWTRMTTATGAGAHMTVVDFDAPNHAARFYRAILLPPR